MSCWIYPFPFESASGEHCLDAGEFILPGRGLADLARAQGPDQIADWLRQLHPHVTPEQIALLTRHYWRLSHELTIEDTLIIRMKADPKNVSSEDKYIVGEITGSYFRADRAGEMAHILPVQWNTAPIAVKNLPRLTLYANSQVLTEIEDSDVLLALKPHVASLNKGHASFFRWMSIAILIFELIYFWPRNATH